MRFILKRFPYVGYHYLATLSPGIYAEPMTSLVHQVRSAIIALSDQAHSIGKSIQRNQIPSTNMKPRTQQRARRSFP